MHYIGWDSSYDEWVPDDRIRYPGPDSQKSSDNPPSAGRVPADFPKYTVGRSVEVLYGTSDWYQAEVLKTEHGQYFIHYTGYDSSYDEWVGDERIRAPELRQVVYRPADRYVYKVGDRVKVRSGSPGFTHDAEIVEIAGGKYRIRFDGYDSTEWRSGDGIRLPEENEAWEGLMYRFRYDTTAGGILGYFGNETPASPGEYAGGPEVFATEVAVFKRETPFGKIDRQGRVSVGSHLLGRITRHGNDLSVSRNGRTVGTVAVNGRIAGTLEGGSRYERGMLGRIDPDGRIFDSSGEPIGAVDPHTGYLLDYWGYALPCKTETERKLIAAFMFFFTELPHAMKMLGER